MVLADQRGELAPRGRRAEPVADGVDERDAALLVVDVLRQDAACSRSGSPAPSTGSSSHHALM
ncbi:hypothetical protein [Sorangium sp. So ce233]|uniref:hypothetical protein n=1 Tax=Sorangium sp. So ce233 TaxID=3133290 RepID=UPI003F5E38CB